MEHGQGSWTGHQGCVQRATESWGAGSESHCELIQARQWAAFHLCWCMGRRTEEEGAGRPLCPRALSVLLSLLILLFLQQHFGDLGELDVCVMLAKESVLCKLSISLLL